MATPQQITEWDANGNPVTSPAVQEWDANGKPVQASPPTGESQVPGVVGAVSRFGNRAAPYMQALGSELGSAWDAAKGVFTAPYHAVVDPSTPKEQQQYPHATGADWDPRTAFSMLARAGGRMVGEPTADAAIWYGKEAKTGDTNFLDKVLSVAPQAIGTGAGTEVGGKLIPSAIGRGADITELAQRRAALSSAIDNAEGLTRQAKTLNVIDKTAQRAFNRTKQTLGILQGKLKADAQKSIQPFIDADNSSGQKAVYPTQAALEVSKALSQTDYVPKPAEQALLDQLSETPQDRIAKQLGYPDAETAKSQVGSLVYVPKPFDDFVRKGAGGIRADGLSLDQTLKLRSAIGNAMSRAKDPKARLVLRSAYDGMNDSINGRMNELQGKTAVDANGKPITNKAFTQYNENHKAAFELTDSESFTSKLMEDTLDHHEARDRLKNFTEANLTQVAKQMKDKGMNPKEIYQLQKDAKSVLSARDSVMGKYNKSLGGVMRGTPSESILPISVYAMTKGAGLYGIVPYMAAVMAGRIPKNMAIMSDFAGTMKRLGVSDAAIDTRTQPGPYTPVAPGTRPAPTPAPSVGGGSPDIDTGMDENAKQWLSQFQKNKPNMKPAPNAETPWSPDVESLWQKHVHGKESEVDKIERRAREGREENPEPTREEVKAGEIKRAKQSKNR